MKLTNLTAFTLGFVLAVSVQAQQPERVRFNTLVIQSDSLLYDQPQTSLSLALEASELAKQQGLDSLRAIALNRVGISQWSIGNQLEAIEKIQASLQISEVEDYEALKARNLWVIGKIYAASGLDLDALGYFRSALSLQTEIGGKQSLFEINNDIGNVFLDVKNYDSALKYFERSGVLLDESFKQIHSSFFLSRAEFHYIMNDFEKADSLVKLSIENATSFKSMRWIILGNELKAKLERKKSSLDDAYMYAEEAYRLAKQSGVKELIYRTSKTLSDCLGALGRYEEAYQKQQVFEAYLDSVRNIATINELELLSYYQRLFQVRVLESKNELNKQVADQRQLIIQGLVLALIIAGILIAIIVLVVRELGIRKRELEKLNAFRSKIFAIVSHDLKSPIQSVSSVIELFNEKLISKEEIEPVLPEVRAKTANLLSLLNNVFLWAEGQMEGENFSREVFVLNDVLEPLEQELSDRLQAKEIKLDYSSARSFKLYSNPGIIRILLRNLVVNAIKFSNRNATVEINAVEGEKVKIIEVIDNGIGISSEMLESIFSGGLVSTDGTQGEKGNGLGLALCHDFAKSLGGKIEVESKLGEGSVFRIILKRANVPK